ncbi:MAG: hypothetical protein J6J24_01875 [Clostridia bacterium]|nr:hypothetical protein [Clostridia bacterium]
MEDFVLKDDVCTGKAVGLRKTAQENESRYRRAEKEEKGRESLKERSFACKKISQRRRETANAENAYTKNLEDEKRQAELETIEERTR